MFKLSDFFEKSVVIQALRQAIIMCIPILLIGSFCLIFRIFPNRQYQIFLENFQGGILLHFLDDIYRITFLTLGVYITLALSISIVNTACRKENRNFSLVFVSLMLFFLFSGVFHMNGNTVDIMGENDILVSLLAVFFSYTMFNIIDKYVKVNFKLYSSGADASFTQMLNMLPKIIITLICGFLLYCIMVFTTGEHSLQNLITDFMYSIIKRENNKFTKTLIFALFQLFIWLFGIRKFNIIFPGSTQSFISNPCTINSHTAWNVFASIGGCGSTMCLAIAILIFGKKNTSKKLVRLSSIPILFNVNELLLFGLPVVLNPIYIIPFTIVPIVNYGIAFLASYLSIIPQTLNYVEWTTPPIISGFLCTGNISGSLIQIINLAVGILIYTPFVIHADKKSLEQENKMVADLICQYKELEESGEGGNVLCLKGIYGVLARTLADEIKCKIDRNEINLKYQPQFNNKNECIGVESLLSLEYSNYGKLYTPFVIGLTKEMEYQSKLEKAIFIVALNDCKKIVNSLGPDCKIAINITGNSIQTQEFEEFLVEMADKYKDYIKNILIEITEQDSLKIDEELISRLERLKKLGYSFGIDDFSMGSTSIRYLKYNIFDLVKIDGNLSKDVVNNERSRDIVKVMAGLTNRFGIDILAEYVEDKKQKDILEKIGCYEYQGYYFSQAVNLNELDNVIENVSNAVY